MYLAGFSSLLCILSNFWPLIFSLSLTHFLSLPDLPFLRSFALTRWFFSFLSPSFHYPSFPYLIFLCFAPFFLSLILSSFPIFLDSSFLSFTLFHLFSSFPSLLFFYISPLSNHSLVFPFLYSLTFSSSPLLLPPLPYTFISFSRFPYLAVPSSSPVYPCPASLTIYNPHNTVLWHHPNPPPSPPHSKKQSQQNSSTISLPPHGTTGTVTIYATLHQHHTSELKRKKKVHLPRERTIESALPFHGFLCHRNHYNGTKRTINTVARGHNTWKRKTASDKQFPFNNITITTINTVARGHNTWKIKTASER